MNFILESSRGLWKDFKCGNRISKRLVSLYCGERFGGTLWEGNAAEQHTPGSYRQSVHIRPVSERRERQQDGEEEEHQQKAGPQGLCGDDSEKASISEQFSIGEDRAGDLGDVQYLEC